MNVIDRLINGFIKLLIQTVSGLNLLYFLKPCNRLKRLEKKEKEKKKGNGNGNLAP